MTIKETINKSIIEYDIWLKSWLPKQTDPQLVYDTRITASPLRQLITLLRFIDYCEEPIIFISDHDNPVIRYNNEFINYINYLGICGIYIKLFIVSSYCDNSIRQLYTQNSNNIDIKFIYDYSIITDHIVPKNQGVYKICSNSLIFAYDKSNQKKQLILSENLIMLTSFGVCKNLEYLNSL